MPEHLIWSSSIKGNYLKKFSHQMSTVCKIKRTNISLKMFLIQFTITQVQMKENMISL